MTRALVLLALILALTLGAYVKGRGDGIAGERATQTVG